MNVTRPGPDFFWSSAMSRASTAPRNQYGDLVTRIPKLPQTGVFAYANFFTEGTGKQLSNTLYWQGSAPPSSGYNPSTFAQSIYTALVTKWAACLSNVFYCNGVRVFVHNGPSESTGIYLLSTPGSVAVAALPDEVAAVVQRQTPVAGRSGRGRIFVRGLPNTFVTESRLNSTGVAALSTLITGLQATITDQSIIWTPAHFIRKPVSPAVLGYFEPIGAWVLDGNVGTSRRSRPRF